VLPAAVAWTRWRFWSDLGHEGSHRGPLLLAPICNLRETNGTAAGCCILPSSVGMRRKKDRLCVCKLRERNGTDAGCCILPASAGMRRWNGWQRTGIAGRWQGHLEWRRDVHEGVVGRGGRAAEQIWWLTGFPGLAGETDGESLDGGAYGRRALVGGVDVAVFTYLPASSRGNPRSGLPDRRWRHYGVVFPLGGFAFEVESARGPVVCGGRRCWAAG
jgi:hypothetical protein